MNSKELVLQIQNALSQPETRTERDLRQLARQYALACDEVNRRLADCELHLRLGFRSEAVRQCNSTPDLISEYNSLSFQEHGEWSELSSQLGVIVPRLDRQQAVAISRARKALHAVQDHVARYRRQNVFDRSLKERAQTLLHLKKLEPQEDAWQKNLDDLRS